MYDPIDRKDNLEYENYPIMFYNFLRIFLQAIPIKLKQISKMVAGSGIVEEILSTMTLSMSVRAFQ